MNEWERQARLAESVRRRYPEGTRLVLTDTMDDLHHPIPSGTRGTVKWVDDMAHIGMSWDTGGSLSIIYGKDSFRKLTQEEIDEEEAAICVEETTDEMLEGQDNTPVQSM